MFLSPVPQITQHIKDDGRMMRTIEMIVLCWASLMEPRGHPGGTSGRPLASPTSRVLQTERFQLIGRPAELPSPLPEISHIGSHTSQNVRFSYGNINVCEQNLLQTIATATFRKGRFRIILWIILRAFHPCPLCHECCI